MSFEELKEQYLIDITLEEDMIDKQTLQLPKVMAKYQFFYNDTLRTIADAYDTKDKIFNDCVMQYKRGQGELGNFTLNATELKQLIESSVVMRECRKNLAHLEADLKTIEEMLSTIKSIGYNIKNHLDYKKIIHGII